MSRCNICDQPLEKIQFNREGKIEPCGDCIESVKESLDEFEPAPRQSITADPLVTPNSYKGDGPIPGLHHIL